MDLSNLLERIGSAVPGSEPAPFDLTGCTGIRVAAGSIAGVLTFLRDDPGFRFNMLVDLTAIDREAETGKLAVVYVLRSFSTSSRLVVQAEIDAAEPVIATASGIWSSANWAEREVWDLFGIRFDGHPDLRRILMYEEFEGHPLRKSYPYDKRQPLVPERDPIDNPWPERR